jgi:hypothetical protein
MENWPFALIATTTHDTKRSEAVRLRINSPLGDRGLKGRLPGLGGQKSCLYRLPKVLFS